MSEKKLVDSTRQMGQALAYVEEIFSCAIIDTLKEYLVSEW